jgi:DNA-3-methyladenine glycosylase II
MTPPLASPPPPFPHPPEWGREAIAWLVARDPTLDGIEARVGPLPWQPRSKGFPGLVRSICGQMISNEAAGAVWRRVAALPGATTPEGLLAIPPERLGIEGGLRRAQVKTARALAEAILDGRLRFDAVEAMGDEEAIAALCTVKGIGRWTAEVFLLFGQGRADIFPAGDLALQAAARHLRGLEERPGAAALLAIAEVWRPYRAVAARLLWHHWLHHTKRATMEPEGNAPA